MFFGKKKNNVPNQGDDRIKVDTSTITTMVGADTVIEGCLKTKSSVRINGTVIGDVRADGVVVLTKTGHIIGTIEADSIIVAGVVEGNMSIRDKVNVEASGEIYGDVITKKFVIDEESIFQGNCITNRDGKFIPVPPYKKSSDEEETEVDNKDKDNKDKAEKEKEEEKKSEDKADKKEEQKEDEKEDSKEDKADSDDKDSEESEAQSDDKQTDDEKNEDSDKEEADDEDDKDNEIIIADINDVEAPEDIPTSGGEQNEKKKNKNYIKKSKSLSVEIENE